MIWFVFRILILCNDSTSQKTSAVWKYYGMDVQNHTVHCRWLRKAECILMGSSPCSCLKVRLLHNSTTRGRFCLKNWRSSSILMFFVVYYSAAVMDVSPSVYLLFLLLAAASGLLRLNMFSPVMARLWTGLRAASPSPPLTAASEWSRKPADIPLEKKDTNQLVKQPTVLHCAWGAVATTFAEMSILHATHV